jgi:uncharacterized protein (UPF0333 family)
MVSQKKAQLSIEYLILTGIILIFLLPILYYAFSNSIQNLKMHQANELVKRIAETADTLYILGPGSQDTIKVIVPGGVENITFGNRQVYLRIKIFTNVSDVIAETKANINGSIKTKAGSYFIKIKNEDDVIQVTNQ